MRPFLAARFPNLASRSDSHVDGYNEQRRGRKVGLAFFALMIFFAALG